MPTTQTAYGKKRQIQIQFLSWRNKQREWSLSGPFLWVKVIELKVFASTIGKTAASCGTHSTGVNPFIIKQFRIV
jgi:hypothetical protein